MTEDYSSYESVDEEGEPEPKKSNGKKKSAIGKAVENERSSSTTRNAKTVPEQSAPPTKGGPRGGAKSSKAGGGSKLKQKGSIANFFGPAKNK